MSPSRTAHVTEAVAAAAARLAAAGVASPRVDAELLAAHVLAVPRSRLPVVAGMTDDQRRRFDELVARRARREPLQYLTGTAPFRYLELAVGPGVFVPRPETELLVDRVLSAVGPRPDETGGTVVVDLCSGSGALALALAQELAGARVYAVESSPAALRWLRRNAADRASRGDPPVQVIDGDVADPGLLAMLRGAVDVVMSNPPYVPEGTPVPPEVADHEPAGAVFAGPDGLAVIRHVVARAADLLRPGGLLVVEHDDTHGEAVPALLVADGRFADVADHRDLAGRPRFASATRTPRTGGASGGR